MIQEICNYSLLLDRAMHLLFHINSKIPDIAMMSNKAEFLTSGFRF